MSMTEVLPQEEPAGFPQPATPEQVVWLRRLLSAPIKGNPQDEQEHRPRTATLVTTGLNASGKEQGYATVLYSAFTFAFNGKLTLLWAAERRSEEHTSELQ